MPRKTTTTRSGRQTADTTIPPPSSSSASQAGAPSLAPAALPHPVPAIQTPDLPLDDRMLRYQRNPICPECAAHPVICMLRKPGRAIFRCRECGHKWEVAS